MFIAERILRLTSPCLITPMPPRHGRAVACPHCMTPEQEAHFRVLKVLEQHPEYSQRDLAEATGFSLGRTHYVLHALVVKGFLKIDHSLGADGKLVKTAYLLTPDGIHQRMALTRGYIERKQLEYDALRVELEDLRRELHEGFSPHETKLACSS